MIRVKPSAWKTGTIWKSLNGQIDAVIMGPDPDPRFLPPQPGLVRFKESSKIVKMRYNDAAPLHKKSVQIDFDCCGIQIKAEPGEVIAGYSHRHMLKYFKPLDESLIVRAES